MLNNDEQTYNYHTQADNKDEDKTVLHNVVHNEDNLCTKGRVDIIPSTQLIHSLVN